MQEATLTKILGTDGARKRREDKEALKRQVRAPTAKQSRRGAEYSAAAMRPGAKMAMR